MRNHVFFLISEASSFAESAVPEKDPIPRRSRSHMARPQWMKFEELGASQS